MTHEYDPTKSAEDNLRAMLEAAGAVTIDLNPPIVEETIQARLDAVDAFEQIVRTAPRVDETESLRRAMQPHEDLAATTERTWTTEQLSEEFEVIGFLAPFVVARRLSDGKKGSLEFTHNPRVYFNWVEDK